MGLFSKIKKTLKFEFSHMLKFTKNILKNPWRGSFFLNTPLGTKFLNKVTGKNYKATVGQLGGSTQTERDAYESKHGAGSLGFANATNAIANVIAGFYAGQGALSAVGKGASALGSKLAGSQGIAGAIGKGATAVGSKLAPAAAATGAPAASPTATLGMPEAAAAAAPVAGAGAGAAAPVASSAAGAGASGGQAAGGFLSGLKNFATSEQGMALIGGALQGFGSDLQQRRALEEQGKYSRPFTTEEISSITSGADIPVPGGYLSRAREISQFLTGPVAPPTRTPEQVAAMARGGQ